MTNPEAQAIIQVRNLKAQFEDQVILDHVSFDIRRGEIFVMLGGSGCGKTTLLKHMIGLYRPAGGSVLIDGRDLARADADERSSIIRRFGVMYQSGALFGSMDLLENVCLAMEEFTELPLEARETIGRMKLSLVGLADYCHHLPSEISGGMQKRAAIARAMALDPDILFLDELSAGLDPITSADLDRLVVKLSRTLGVTFVVVTHELPSIFAIADRVIMLDKEARGIIAEGRPVDLRDHSPNKAVRQFFNRAAGKEDAGAETRDEGSRIT
jgi:phospholipid/cholesterol/gamma-HCH transport system ATP-binding protein